METGLTKQKVLAELTRSEHGNLQAYLPVGMKAQAEDPEFFAHLIAWNAIKGEVRDARIALPAIGALAPQASHDLYENALAHLAQLNPRSFYKAVDFTKAANGGKLHAFRTVRRLIGRYLQDLEANCPSWDRTAVQHKKVLKKLYRRFHVKPSDRADAYLFKELVPPRSVFGVIKRLKDMDPVDAAGHILHFKIPFLVAAGALGEKIKDPALVQALISQMSPTELVTNTKMLERLGIKTVPELRSAYEDALKRAAESKKLGATLKTTVAAEAVDDEQLAAKLKALQEKQLQKLSIDGNWLILGDKSGSMGHAIEAARNVAGILARSIAGKVHLIFFDSSPRYFDVSGKTYEEITHLTRHVSAGGLTSVGCGLQYAVDSCLDIDGIAIVSDGGENANPAFTVVYQYYTKQTGKQIPVYFYHINNHQNVLARNCHAAGVDVSQFDLPATVDYYSLPNLVATMRTNRYSVLDEIMTVPLLKVNDVLKRTTNMEVFSARQLEAC